MSAIEATPSLPGTPQSYKSAATKQCIVWDSISENALIASVMEHEAYKRVSKKGGDKWAKVADQLNSNLKLKKYFSGAGIALNSETCRKKWQRMRKTVETKFALSAEGVNLSRYSDESVSENEKLIINLLEELMQTDQDKAEKTEKERKRESNMLGHEANVLTHHSYKKMKISVENDGSGEEEISDEVSELTTMISSKPLRKIPN
jgi:hypothetical protein